MGNVGAGLVDGGIVVGGEYLHGVDAEGLEVVDVVELGKGKELARIFAAAGGVDGEVAVVHLVDDEVGGAVDVWASVFVPSFGIGRLEVDDGCSPAVDANGCGEGAGTFAAPHVEGVVLAFEVALDCG